VKSINEVKATSKESKTSSKDNDFVTKLNKEFDDIKIGGKE
jgi:hypothetical protein